MKIPYTLLVLISQQEKVQFARTEGDSSFRINGLHYTVLTDTKEPSIVENIVRSDTEVIYQQARFEWNIKSLELWLMVKSIDTSEELMSISPTGQVIFKYEPQKLAHAISLPTLWDGFDERVA
jgi:hypothetical protein